MVAADLGPAVIGLIGVLAGSFVAGIFGYLTLKAALKAQREERAEQRDSAREERKATIDHDRMAFQTETLLEVQLAVGRRIRTAGATKVHDELAYREHPEAGWGRTGLSTELNDEAFQADVVVGLLIPRVADEELRILLRTFLGATDAITAARSQSDAETAYNDASDLVAEVDDRITELLRDLPAPGSRPRPLEDSPTANVLLGVVQKRHGSEMQGSP